MNWKTLHENIAVRSIHTPGQHAASAHYGSWVSMAGFRRALLVAHNGELDGDMAFKVYEDIDGTGDNAQEVDTALRNSFVNGTDEGRVGLIELRDSDLSDGYPYFTLQVTPGATDHMSAIALLSEALENPVDNGTGDGVAWVDHL